MHDLWLEKIEEKQFDRYFKKAYTNAEAMRLDWKGIAFLITIEQILKLSLQNLHLNFRCQTLILLSH